MKTILLCVFVIFSFQCSRDARTTGSAPDKVYLDAGDSVLVIAQAGTNPPDTSTTPPCQTCPPGPQGPQGIQGVPGPKGDKGDTGNCTGCPSGGGSGSATQNTFDVVNFGAKGDGNTDDTQAFQNAFNQTIAKNGELIIPSPSQFYKITNTINVVPCSGCGQVWIKVKSFGRGQGGSNVIRYMGPSNRVVFNLAGLKNNIWDQLYVGVNSGIRDVIVFDVDTKGGAQSTTFTSFNNFYIDTGDQPGNVGFRIGHTSAGGNGDVSNIHWQNCTITGKKQPGQVAYLHEGRNSLSFTWMGGFVSYMDKLYSNKSSTAGAKDDRGNGSVFFYGMGASQNNMDYEIAFEQAYTINGGRYEAGKRFLNIIAGGLSAITVSNVELNQYLPSDNIVINAAVSTSLQLNNLKIALPESGSYSSPPIVLNSPDRSATFQMFGGGIASTSPYVRQGGQAWDITMLGVHRLQSVYSAGFFPNELGVRKSAETMGMNRAWIAVIIGIALIVIIIIVLQKRKKI